MNTFWKTILWIERALYGISASFFKLRERKRTGGRENASEQVGWAFCACNALCLTWNCTGWLIFCGNDIHVEQKHKAIQSEKVSCHCSRLENGDEVHVSPHLFHKNEKKDNNNSLSPQNALKASSSTWNHWTMEAKSVKSWQERRHWDWIVCWQARLMVLLLWRARMLSLTL